MKKRFVQALAIALALALGGALAAAEAFPAWDNGQSPGQPYEGVPPVDLTKKLGYMVLDPLNSENVDTAVNALRIYLPRADAAAGDGTLRLFEKGAKAPIQEISFADGARVTSAPIDAETLAWLYWESGVQFTVALDSALDADRAYAVSLDADCIVAPGYGIGNTPLDGAKGWTFTTQAASGVVGRTRSGGKAPRVGDTLAVEIKLGEGAASAMIFCDSEALVCEDEPLTKSGTLTGTYEKEGLVRWGVALTDSSGQLLSVYHYSEEVLSQ